MIELSHYKLLLPLCIATALICVTEGDSYRYCSLPESVTMFEAILVCSLRGMRLAQPKTVDSLNNLGEFLATEGQVYAQGWVHLNYVGYWVWGDGTNFTNGNLWADGEPGGVEGGKLCVRFRYSSLYTADCSLPKPPFCEYDPTATSRGFRMRKGIKNAVPGASVTAMTNYESGSLVFCLVKCLQNSNCESFAVTCNDICILYASVVTSGLVSENGSVYYVMPCFP